MWRHLGFRTVVTASGSLTEPRPAELLMVQALTGAGAGAIVKRVNLTCFTLSDGWRSDIEGPEPSRLRPPTNRRSSTEARGFATGLSSSRISRA
jgi:hypothetical protein